MNSPGCTLTALYSAFLQVHYTGVQHYDACGHDWSQVNFRDQVAWIALEFLD
jgi:hypothetical protein